MRDFLHSQIYSECALVAAINAAIFLGRTSISQGSSEYERLVDLVGARDGSAIRIEKAWEYLQIQEFAMENSVDRIRQESISSPVEIVISHPETYGIHCALIIGSATVSHAGACVHVLNMRKIAPQDFITWRALDGILFKNRSDFPARVFSLAV